jgi:Cation transport protein
MDGSTSSTFVSLPISQTQHPTHPCYSFRTGFCIWHRRAQPWCPSCEILLHFVLTFVLNHGAIQANYSFSGDFKILSKLIVCVVMIRGRHRGLPVAIDRAILFPKEFKLDRSATMDAITTEFVTQSPDTISQTEGRTRSMEHHPALPHQHLPPPILSQPSDNPSEDSDRIRFEASLAHRPRKPSHGDHLSMLSDRSTRPRSESTPRTLAQDP